MQQSQGGFLCVARGAPGYPVFQQIPSSEDVNYGLIATTHPWRLDMHAEVAFLIFENHF